MTDDDELQARLQMSDPAASLPPAAPHEVARLLEDVMATELTTRPESEGSRETGTRNRGPLTWLVAAAAVLVMAGVGIIGVRALTGDDTAPTAADPAPTATATDPEPQGITTLSLPETAGAGKCMVPNAEALASADIAFDGVVTSILDDDVFLEPSHWYAGQSSGEVVVTAPSEQMQRVASGVTFQVGDRYLVSATDFQVSLCGFSAAYSDDLAAIYAAAFPG
jgi:hypothetical protein